MKIKLNAKYLYLFLGFLFSGCVTMNANYDPQKFASGNQSVVILTSLLNHTDLDDKHLSYEKLQSSWENIQLKHNYVVNEYPMTIFNKGLINPAENKEPFEILFIEPGKYHLESYIVRFQDPLHDSYYSNTVSPNGVTFEIKSGEVVYLGDLCVDDIASGKFSINDSFIKAQDYLKQRYPELLPRLKKRFMHISPAVYVDAHPLLKMMFGGLKERKKEFFKKQEDKSNH